MPVTEPDSSSDRQAQVYAEQIRMLYRQLPGGIASPILGAGILAYALWKQVPQIQVITWLTVVTIVYAIGPLSLYRAYRSVKPADEQMPKWGTRYVALAVITTTCWGAAGVALYVPGSELYQILLVAVLFIGGAAVLPATASYRPAFLAAIIPILLPLAIRLAIEGNFFQITILALVLIHFSTLYYSHHQMHNALVRSLNLQFENLDLMMQAEQANRAKSGFLAAASHDLRQPLHAQGLFVAELQARIKDPECRKIIGYLKSSIATMRNLFNGLLDISKLDAEIVEPEFQDFPVMRLMKELQLEYAPQMRQKGLDFTVAPCEFFVHSDPVLLDRIIRNLLSNALRYTDSGSVSLDCRKNGDRVEIQVRDSGCGIPIDRQKVIFEEYYQLGNPERNREKGLGLGLAIVDRLSRILGHPVELTSQPGKGSVFSVHVPVSTAPALQIAKDKTSNTAASNVRGMSVLVIEDDAAIRTAMRGLLQDWGCKVVVVSSTEEALACLPEVDSHLDAIVADYRLCGQATGIQAIAAVQQELQAAVPAILVTGDTNPERLRDAQASGHYLLHKPIEPGQLYEWLKSIHRK